MRVHLHDCTLVVHRDQPSDASIMVSETGDPDRVFWLPRSQIEIGEVVGEHKFWLVREITMPQWLAEEKGIV